MHGGIPRPCRKMGPDAMSSMSNKLPLPTPDPHLCQPPPGGAQGRCRLEPMVAVVRTVVFSAALVLLAGCATSSAQQAAAGPGSEEAHVHSEQPSIPAEQLRDGLLHLLEALHTQVMDPALVERSLGVRMGRVEGRNRVFGTYGPVDEGWNYSVDLVRRDDAEPYIDIYLFPDRLPGKRWVLTQCTLDPHAFANALRQAGWTVRDKPYWYVKAWYLLFRRP